MLVGVLVEDALAEACRGHCEDGDGNGMEGTSFVGRAKAEYIRFG
jgi:hypothetical protein